MWREWVSLEDAYLDFSAKVNLPTVNFNFQCSFFGRLSSPSSIWECWLLYTIADPIWRGSVYATMTWSFIIIIIVLVLTNFSHQFQLGNFHCSLTDSNSLRVFRTLPNILADFSCSVDWVVWILPLITSPPKLFSSLLKTVPSTQVKIGITYSTTFSDLWPSSVMCPVFRFAVWWNIKNNWMTSWFLLWIKTISSL